MLYLVATPIGNLQDITARAIEVLKSVEWILCEDTRHSQVLFSAIGGVKARLKSYHAFNETAELEEVLAKLETGAQMALISDAGTPGVCDPGERLIAACWERGISVTSIPGPSAWVVALSLLPIVDKKKVQFFGFFPKQSGERKKTLLDIFFYQGISFFYESPNRIVALLTLLERVMPSRECFIFRELTKKYEQMVRGNPKSLLAFFSKEEPRGEFVVAVASGQEFDESLSIEEHVSMIQKIFELDKREAVKVVAEMRAIGKRGVYARVHQE